MYPSYRYMDPYPQHFPLERDQNPYPYHQYPIWETVPPYMRVDPSKPPSASGPCPCNGPFSHPNPAEHHSCCNYSYPPGYYSFRPPYSHVLPPPQPYYHGPYPSYPDSNPAFIPPPYYHCDYDKAKDHCCGCPNHTCHRKVGSNVKIEEQKPETEPKESDSSGLIRLPNYPYPVVWFPPSQMKEEERANHMKDDTSNGNSISQVPLVMNSLKGLQQGGEEKKHQHGEEKKMQFPWPIICMPGYDKLEDSVKDLKEINAGPKSVEELPSKFKIIPLKLLENESRGEKPETAEDEPKNKDRPVALAEKEGKIKTIAVKPMEEKNDTKHNMHVKEKKKGEEKEEVGAKKDSSVSKPASPKKPSKLPPVCLRVDPLPKKKTSNGLSCSPSPPGRKEEKSHQDNIEPVPSSKETKEEAPKKAIRVVDIGKSSKPETVPVLSLKSTTGQPGDEIEGKGEGKQEVDMVVGAAESPESKPVEEGIEIKEEHEIEKKETVVSSEIEERGKMKERQRVLSESDAAVLIQSTYRGWEVRRWQPLEKLRKIARIREQVTDVKRQIEDLEASSEHEDMKRRVVINETIMTLLLQLDTIQGLHPNLREIRKSVTRDLIALQEKLDSLGSQATRENKPAEVEKMSDKTSNDESHSGVSLSPEELAPEEGSAQPAAADGVAMQPSFEVKEENDADQKSHKQISKGENEALEMKSEQPVQQMPLLKAENMSYGREEHKEAPLVKEENLASEVAGEEPQTAEVASEPQTAEVASEVAGEEPQTAEDTSKPSGEETVVLSSGEMTPFLGMQELSSLKDVTSLPSIAVEDDVSDGGTGQNEEVELELEKPLETSFDECINQEEKPSVLSLEEGNKLKEAAVMAKAEQVSKSIVEEPVEVPVGEKNNGLIVTPQVQNEEADTSQELQLLEDNFHAQERLGDIDVDNSSSSDASFPEPTMEVDNVEGSGGEEKSETATIMAETIEVNNPVPVEDRDLITRVLESGEEDGVNSTLDKAASPEAVESNSETSLELAMDKVDTPATKEAGVAADQEEDAPAQPLMVATVDNTPRSDLVTGSLSAEEMSSDEKKVMENEKLREMLEQLLEAGKQQLGIISDLNGRVKELEKKLSQKKRVRARRNKLGRGSLS